MASLPGTGGIVNALNRVVEAIKNLSLGGGTVATKAEVATGTDNAKFVSPLAMTELLKSPEGTLWNGKIVVSVASNNLTVAIKGKDGNDPSATNPVYVMINGTLRTITAALSVTKNAATNWFNAGSSELATKEINYFVYLGYNATDGVVIGFSRIVGNQYSDFSTITTNEKYCAISTITNAVSTDYYNVIGRFAATLSAGAGYTWSVPTFTAINLIQRPIFETRWLIWVPTYSAVSPMTFTSVTTDVAVYKVVQSACNIILRAGGTTGGTASAGINATLPFLDYTGFNVVTASAVFDATTQSGSFILTASTNNATWQKYNVANWALGASKWIFANLFYKI